jgi:hypothetical protein
MQTESKILAGSILYDSWGWEQTNIDFYKVLKRSGDWVTIQKMTTKQEYNSLAMSGYKIPVDLDSKEKPFRKKVKKYSDSEGFSIRDYAGGGWCSLWDGQKKNFTTYA